MSNVLRIPSILFFQGFPVQQYGSGGMSGYPSQPLQYPAGPQQRCAPSPSYPSSRLPLMGQYPSGSHNPGQFPPGAGQPNPPQYYKVTIYLQTHIKSRSAHFVKTLFSGSAGFLHLVESEDVYHPELHYVHLCFLWK